MSVTPLSSVELHNRLLYENSGVRLPCISQFLIMPSELILISEFQIPNMNKSPACTLRRNDILLTSIRRHNIEMASNRRREDVITSKLCLNDVEATPLRTATSVRSFYDAMFLLGRHACAFWLDFLKPSK